MSITQIQPIKNPTIWLMFLVASLAHADIDENLLGQNAIFWEEATQEQLLRLNQGLIDYSELKDPFSVQFRHVATVVIPGGHIKYCGHYNAKNSIGAYIGWDVFVAYEKTDGKWIVIIGKSEDHSALVRRMCTNISG